MYLSILIKTIIIIIIIIIISGREWQNSKSRAGSPFPESRYAG
jgi:hypothetical protein